MKAIFKKNQIIITALAIMIAVVGYLNFAKDKDAEEDRESALSAASNSLGNGSDVDGENYGDLSAEDLGEDQFFMYQVSDTGELILTENNAAGNPSGENASTDGNLETGTDSILSNDGETADPAATGAPDGTGVPEGEGTTSRIDTEGNGDPADETGLDGMPGEAVFTSVMIQEGFFSSAKLGREQMRAKNKETLMAVVSDSTVADELKQNAIDEIIAITARAEMENAAEILLEARGYEGVVVSLSETEADVVVNAESITEQQIAQIEDIVSRKTGIGAEGIVITTVIIEE